jgi:hypothetical protein
MEYLKKDEKLVNRYEINKFVNKYEPEYFYPSFGSSMGFIPVSPKSQREH